MAGKTAQSGASKVSCKGDGGVEWAPWGWWLNVSSWGCSTYTCWSKGMVDQCPKKKAAQLIWRQDENSLQPERLWPDVTKQLGGEFSGD